MGVIVEPGKKEVAMPKCDHIHDPDSFILGSVYEVIARTEGGFMLRSTPMTGEEAKALMDELAKQYNNVSMKLMTPHEARDRLERDAAEWRQDAIMVEDHLADRHEHFRKSGEDRWKHADNLERRARAIGA